MAVKKVIVVAAAVAVAAGAVWLVIGNQDEKRSAPSEEARKAAEAARNFRVAPSQGFELYKPGQRQ